MRLHIENEKTERLARELAALTGQTLPAAFTDVLRERLERIKNEHASSRFTRPRSEGANPLSHTGPGDFAYSTVTDFAKFLG